jgi:hypothetical protein
LLVDFQTDVKANANRTWALQFGGDVQPVAPPERLEIAQGEEVVVVDTGTLRFEVPRQGRRLIRSISRLESGAWQSVSREGARCRIWTPQLIVGKVRLHQDLEYFTEVRDAQVLTTGPLHAVILVEGTHRSDQYEDLLRFQAEIHVYAGRPTIEIDYTVVNRLGNYLHPVDEPSDYFHQHMAQPSIGTIDIEIQLDDGLRSYRLGMEGEEDLKGEVPEGAEVQLYQTGPGTWDGGTFEVVVQRSDADERKTVHRGARAGGWVAAQGSGVQVCAGVRYFWQQHPKAIRVDGRKLSLGLWSPPRGYFSMERGLAKAHRVLLSFGPPEALFDADLAGLSSPLRAVAPPAWYCDSKALGDLCPVDSDAFPRYEAFAEKGLPGFLSIREEKQEYGVRDFGDWSYSRYLRGWGNIEYDLPYAFLLQFVRSGDVEFLEEAERNALHFIDIDIIHDDTDHFIVGAPHVHANDHRNEDISYDAAFGRYDPGHIWVQGLLTYHFLTGHRRAIEVAEGIGDFTARLFERTRVIGRQVRQIGWPLVSLTAMYEATGKEHYLCGARRVMDQALEWQDPERGHFPHPIGMISPSECLHFPRCLGTKPFQMGVVMEGLRMFYQQTGDEAVAEAVRRGAKWLVDEAWVEHDRGFYHTSCIDSRDRGSSTLLPLDGLGYAYRLTGDRRYLEVGLKAMEARLPDPDAPVRRDGKGLSNVMRNLPRFLYALKEAGVDSTS